MANGYFRLEVKHINRSTRNIVACASYRADEKLFSERTQEHIQFAKHSIKPESMILTPDHAPEWTKDRSTLWNEVDRIESKKSMTKAPRLATEVLISLPNDIDRDIQTELTKDFVKDEFVSKGMIADVSIHRDDVNNPHAHILLTIRPINADGTWGNKTVTRTKYDENGKALLNKNGNRLREQIRFAELDIKTLRKNWADKLNFYAERENSNRVYDARSFKDQGRKEIAHIPLSREEYRLEKREQKRCKKAGIEYKPVTFYGQLNKEIADYNKGLINDVVIDEKQTKRQNAFNKAVEYANSVIHIDPKAQATLDSRYKYSTGYIEAKETINNMHDKASTYGRKINNDILKVELKTQYYEELIDKYKTDRQSVKDYGFNPETFIEKINNKISELNNEKANIYKQKEVQQNIYQSAKSIYLDNIRINNEIVEIMYPRNFEKFNNDEKAFIVNEALKGNFIETAYVEKAFRDHADIPENLKKRDQYLKTSKDIFFADRVIKNNQNEITENAIENVLINKMFIDSKMEELNELEVFINDELARTLPLQHAKLIEELDVYSKSQLLAKIDSIENKDDIKSVDTVIRNHVNDHKNVHHSKSYQEHNRTDNSHKGLVNNLLNSLTMYANNEYMQGNINSKKKKKKKKDNQQSIYR
ncbi:MobA/MobL family protein [Macrococcoides caseolyticum]|uniref:MobA/MobL family protein n=1 Tax=Macrococcoides caseolyticum TaxID=69966 RepID=UPI000C330756|nr:MobA/MobL family protein [Macrococcus caseolyticus]PKE73642.1 MobA/MobL family protein [Macrococcus caseolyticus]